MRELLESMVIVAKHRTAGLHHVLQRASDGSVMTDGSSKPFEIIVVDEPQRILTKAAREEREREMDERERRGTGPNGDGTGILQDADQQDAAQSGKRKKDRGMKRKDYTDDYVATQQKGTLAKELGFSRFR